MHNKEYALKLVQDKLNGLNDYSYSQIVSLTGFTKRHLIRLSKELNKKDIDSILVHGLTGKHSNNSPSSKEIEFINNYVLLPELMYYRLTKLYNEDSEELIFTDNNLLSIIYSYNEDKISINFEPYINYNDKISEIKPSEKLFNEILKLLEIINKKISKIGVFKPKAKKRSKHLNN